MKRPILALALLCVPLAANAQSPPQDLVFPNGIFQAHIMLRKVKAARSYDTVIHIFDASCAVRIWAAMWVFPIDRVVPPSVKIEMTKAGKIATDFPFEFRLDRDSEAVDEAGFATREAASYDVDQKQFAMYALGNPDEIGIYMAFRPVDQPDCKGHYAVDYVPKGTVR